MSNCSEYLFGIFKCFCSCHNRRSRRFTYKQHNVIHVFTLTPDVTWYNNPQQPTTASTPAATTPAATTPGVKKEYTECQLQVSLSPTLLVQWYLQYHNPSFRKFEPPKTRNFREKKIWFWPGTVSLQLLNTSLVSSNVSAVVITGEVNDTCSIITRWEEQVLYTYCHLQVSLLPVIVWSIKKDYIDQG
jgi:hypothetical protein